MFSLSYNDHRPIYEQIKEKFKQLIISGAMPTDAQLPSVRDLAQQMAINPNTIQRAYKELEAEGYIYSVRANASSFTVLSRRCRRAPYRSGARSCCPALSKR